MPLILPPLERPGDLRGLLQTLGALGRFRTFIAAVAAARMTRELSAGDLTVFAPSDYAFERLRPEWARGRFADLHQLQSLIRGHVVVGEYHGQDLIPFTRLPTTAGTELTLSVGRHDSDILVDGVPFLTTDIVTAGGIVHEIEGVLGG